jgi:hypothetical protein
MATTHLYKEILAWLELQGVHITLRTLERRLRAWGIKYYTTIKCELAASAYQSLVARIEFLYHHHRTYSDAQIARIIQNEDGLPTSRQQIRLLRGWLRRRGPTSDGQSQALETAIFIQQLLIEGRIRQYGIRLLATHLSHKYGHRARGNDVGNTLWLLDQNGITSRRPGFRRKRKDKYTVPGPNWL